MIIQMDFLDAILNENVTAEIKKETENANKPEGCPHNPKKKYHTLKTKKTKDITKNRIKGI